MRKNTPITATSKGFTQDLLSPMFGNRVTELNDGTQNMTDFSDYREQCLSSTIGIEVHRQNQLDIGSV